jgi:uncharacterized protein (TIGR02246 family)
MSCPLRVVLWGIVAVILAPSVVRAADSNPKEIAAIRAAAAAYIKALEAGKADAAAAGWTPDGDYIDAAGHSFKARDLIAHTLSKETAGRHPEVHITVDSIRLTTPETAVEDGRIERRATVGAAESKTRYTAIWVKRDDKWLLDSLRESALPQAPQNARFADLQWLLGEFTGSSGDGAHVVASGTMSRDGNFLLREILITVPDGRVKSISQRIGWDPIAGHFKSWTFDSDGGYGEGSWKREGESWIVNSTGVTPDGKHLSATGIYSQITDDGLMMLSSGATVEGQPRPDMKFKLTREPAHE